MVLVLVFWSSLSQSYLLFHTFVELFSIIITFALFIITWNARKIIENQFLLLVGITYLFIGSLDLLHTLTYKGMNIFPGSTYYANQFWIATRFLEASTILLAFRFLKSKKKLNADWVVLIYTFILVAITSSILYYKVFPECYIEGYGQTDFKIYGEYVVISLLLLGIWLLYKNRSAFDKEVWPLLLWSLIFTIIGEFCFTLYISNYGLSNQIGHYSKLISFYLIYKANIETGFTRPTQLLFNSLSQDEKKYRKLAEDLKTIQIELQNSNASKDKLFSIIAHDLKNPFASILATTDLLKKRVDTMPKDKQLHFLDIIHRTVRESNTLLSNLLEWAKMQTGTLEAVPEQILPAELLQAAKASLESVALAKEIQIEVDISTENPVFADRNMISTALRNLLSNAIKFSPAHSVIQLTATAYADHVNFSVNDSGVGITADAIASFLNNGRLGSIQGTANEKGTGLGLMLSKELIEKNNGKMNIESQPGRGSTFSFNIPACKI
ncbi:sensor histidine kinase [Desertivirga arenae]|uniref:sensor histidine kinase n=1 Tax=Desertivirga arenae TaxID=2810309 RepID=UPI001A97BE72|nr:MASE3 domain-containing protein [Pedobacter sp. SYSU D00823]